MNKGYALCLNEWALDKEIKNELGLLLIISSLCAEKGYCYASNKYLAELFDVSEVSISTKIKKLESKNYISVEYKKRGCEVLERNIRLKKFLTDDLKIFKPTIKENFKENNISNNITSINKKEITKEKFETFYSAYPKKVKKADVEKWFIKHKPSDEEFKKIMQGLENYQTIWKDKDKQFIPYPTTWLNGRQWEDEIERKKTEDEIWKEFHDELVARGEI